MQFVPTTVLKVMTAHDAKPNLTDMSYLKCMRKCLPQAVHTASVLCWVSVHCRACKVKATQTTVGSVSPQR